MAENLSNISIEQLNALLAEDAYFDRAEHGFRAITPDPTGYHKVSGFLALTMPQQRGATMIARATPLGRSKAIDPNRPCVINVDPHVPGGASVVDLSKISKEMVAQAIDMNISDNPRIAAAAAFRKLAIATTPAKMLISDGKNPIKSNSEAAKQVMDLPILEQDMQLEDSELSAEEQAILPPPAALARQPARATAPAQATYPTPSPTPVSRAGLFQPAPFIPPQAYSTTAPVVSPAQAQPPTEQVTIELPKMGMLQAVYHRVIRDNMCLVLVYDKRWTFGMKYMPPASQECIIIDVHSHPNVYRVQSCGIQYSVDDMEHCVLLVEQEAPKQ